ncbi:hypothetical protein BDZ45DRAFT_763946 [Acephala macrosclerotiorum]|nr:hypothetical protein BDZ45DRAFT_763946 [Acephala macrosclerotiorum]
MPLQQEGHLPTTPALGGLKGPKDNGKSEDNDIIYPFRWEYASDDQKFVYNKAINQFPHDKNPTDDQYWVIIGLLSLIQKNGRQPHEKKQPSNTRLQDTETQLEAARKELFELKGQASKAEKPGVEEEDQVAGADRIGGENKTLETRASELETKADNFEKAKNGLILENRKLKKKIREFEAEQKILSKTNRDLQAGNISLDQQLMAALASMDSFKALHDTKFQEAIVLEKQGEETTLVADLRTEITRLQADHELDNPLIDSGISIFKRYAVLAKSVITRKSLDPSEREVNKDGNRKAH